MRDDVRPEDFPDSVADLLEAFGPEITLRICELRGGGPTFIPGTARILKKARNRAIRAEAKDHTAAQLAQRWGLSEPHIFLILRQS